MHIQLSLPIFNCDELELMIYARLLNITGRQEVMETGRDEHAVRDRDPRAAQEHGLQLQDHRAELCGVQRALHHRGDLLHRQGRHPSQVKAAGKTLNSGTILHLPPSNDVSPPLE